MYEKLYSTFYGFFVKNYKVSFLLIVLVMFAGIFSLISIPKESSPDIKFGIISVSTSYSGVNPVDIDSLITDKIEQEIEDIDGIKKITSSSQVGFSSITVELENGVSTRDVMTDIKDKVDSIALPENAEDPVVSEVSSNNEVVFQALLYGKNISNFELKQKANILQDRLEGKGGVTKIDIADRVTGAGGTGGGGGINNNGYEIKVLISKDKLELLGISVSEIASKIRSYNKNTPIGNYTIGDLNYDFRFDGEFSSIDNLNKVIIRDNGGSRILLEDISQIKKEYKNNSIRELGFYNDIGYNYIGMTFNKGAGSNIFSTASSAKEGLAKILELEEFNGLGIQYINDLGEVIKEDYDNLARTAMQTLVLVFITILVFVGLREGLIASFLLPLAFLVTFIVLDTIGLSLNFLTNFSLVLTLGIAIDTFIVIIEGSSERMKLGYTKVYSVLSAIRDLKAPLISGSLTTLSAFLPLMFLPGIVGKFLSYIPITVFITILAALVFSITISGPLFVAFVKDSKYFHEDKQLEDKLSVEEKKLLASQRKGKIELPDDKKGWREKFLGKLGDMYLDTLSKFLHSRKGRWISILAPIGILLFTFIFFSPKIGFILFPPTDNSVINVSIQDQNGSDEESLRKYLPQIGEIMGAYPELKLYNSSISGNTISVGIDLVNKNIRKEKGQRNVFEVENEVTKDFKVFESAGLKVEIKSEAGGPPTGKAIGIQLIANNTNKIASLKQTAEDFKTFLRTLDGTKNVGLSSTDNPGQFVYTFDNDKISYVGLTPDDIINEVRSYTSGIKSGSIKSQYEDNDIVLKVSEFDTNITPKDIENLIITTKIGKIRVGDYVNYTFEPALSSINRKNGKITISVESDIEIGIVPTQVQPLLIAFAEQYSFPEGISFVAGGENAENSDLIISTLKSFVIALFLIYTILVFQFNSYSQPAIIIYSVVLALLGVNIGLLLTGNPYSMPFAIGFIALTGIVVNDAIIFVDKINSLLGGIDHVNDMTGKTEDFYIDYIVQAGKTRLQPIIVTTLTTVFGMLPLALQDEFWAGLGYTVVFGLFAGSTMTLFVIPALYYELYLKKKVK